MEEILKRVDALASKLAEIAAQHGPDAVNIVGKVYQMKAAYEIVWPLPALMLSAFMLHVCSRTLRRLNERRSAEDDVPMIVFPGAVGVISGCLGVMGAFSGTFNPVYWAAAFDPHFAIAANLLKVL